MSIRLWSCAAARLVVAASAALTLHAVFAAGAWAQTSGSSLTLAEALRRAAAADPTAPAWDARRMAADANVRQAGVKPNPTLGIELENFAGTGAYSLLDRTEATVSYQQTLERGGKRSARVDRARADARIQDLRRQVRRLDLARDVQAAYAEALAADAELLIAEARLIAAHRSQTDIERRVRGARDPLFAGTRAETVTAQAEIARDQARDAAHNARAVLAAYWGGGTDYVLNLEDFFNVRAPSVLGDLAKADLALLEAARDAAAASVRLEQARSVTDPTVRAGVRYLGDGDNVAFVVGGSIPLRRFDTNQGGIARAVAERSAAEADLAAERQIRNRETARLTARLSASAREAARIRDEVIPLAQRTVEQVREGFSRGGFQYLDVTEAERALADARARRVAVLRQHHLDQAALDRLTGAQAAILPQTSSAEPR